MCEKLRLPKPFQWSLALSHTNGVDSYNCLSRDNGEVLLLLLFLLNQEFYNRVSNYFNKENKKLKELKKYTIVIDYSIESTYL